MKYIKIFKNEWNNSLKFCAFSIIHYKEKNQSNLKKQTCNKIFIYERNIITSLWFFGLKCVIMFNLYTKYVGV